MVYIKYSDSVMPTKCGVSVVYIKYGDTVVYTKCGLTGM